MYKTYKKGSKEVKTEYINRDLQHWKKFAL